MPDSKPRKAREPSPAGGRGLGEGGRAVPKAKPNGTPSHPHPAPLPPAGEGEKAIAVSKDTLARAAAYLQKGQPTLALPLLLPELDARASVGDTACALAAAALRFTPPDPSPIPPDALSATVSRLVALVRQQDEQIKTLRALIEDAL